MSESEQDVDAPVQGRTAGPFGGLTPSEAGKASAQARRERRTQREEAAEIAGLTVRQRLGLSLSKLTQAQLDAVVAGLAEQAAKGDARAVHALARLTDQAFGRSAPAVDEDEGVEGWDNLTREQRAALRARLTEETQRGEGEGQGDADAEAQG